MHGKSQFETNIFKHQHFTSSANFIDIVYFTLSFRWVAQELMRLMGARMTRASGVI